MRSSLSPARAILALLTVIVLGLGVGAYLVNIPLLWVAVGEVVALAGIALVATRSKRTQPVPSETDGVSKS